MLQKGKIYELPCRRFTKEIHMKKNFALACAAFVTAALMACSDDSNSSAANSGLDTYLSSASDSGINPPIDDQNQGGPADDPSQGGPADDPSQGGPADDPSQGGPAVDPIAPESSADAVPASSAETVPASSETAPASSETVPASSSSGIALGPTEKSFAFGYALNNAPRPSKGCGKTSSLQGGMNVENGTRYQINVNGDNRTFFVTLPKNYDNTKPYKLLIANHCYGSKAEDFVHHQPDYDHPTPYYGQQKLDTEGNYIFAAPQGDDNGMWTKGEKDHQFFDKFLTTLEENYCIDTTRVFATGFSFGAMITNSLAQDFQHRIRAVAVYAVADYNIYLPSNAGKPIAWMGVHGKRDGTCLYEKARDSALPRILKNNGKASDGDSQFTDASSEKPQEFSGTAGHLCYDFKSVDERFPVKFCTWNGQHQWTAHDGPNTDVGQAWQNTWVPEEVHKFFEQF